MSVPLVRMPSLDLIKGFVAVGRRMSVSQAGDDLCVTQSAVSKQLRALEEALDVRLLQRGHRKVSFTVEGERLFRAADAAIRQLQEVVASLRDPGRRPVTLTASLGVSGVWLLPRLAQLRQVHPGIDLRVVASNAVMDLAGSNVDLAIRYCADSQAPRGAIRLFGETIAPVASPALALHPTGWSQQLQQHVLLEFEDRRPWLQWADWLAPQGQQPMQARGLLRFNHYDQVIQAAVSAQGIAIGRLELVRDLVEAGQLVVLAGDGPARQTSHGFWLIQADEHARSDVACVVDWLLAQSGPGAAAA
ncbi:LysR substrate-binding domain-containing protein [Aquabacterium sp.]|uniref:LysR substrate-binding domain-containing protein n=1 Tax=Aquabacterium sp. TaxID=1872578 RepID=UPI00378463CC